MLLGLAIVKDAQETLLGRRRVSWNREARRIDEEASVVFLLEKDGLFEATCRTQGIDCARARALIEEKVGSSLSELWEQLRVDPRKGATINGNSDG
jgi:hypothetical protein